MRTLLLRGIRKFAWLVSEAEAIFVEGNTSIPFRELYLTLNKVKYGKFLRIGRQFHLSTFGNLSLGNRVSLGHYVFVGNYSLITIGDDFLGASGLTINAGTHNPKTLVPEAYPIQIGKRVWCGMNVTILAGVSIGDDVVIGAGSVVVKDIPNNSIAVGVPARVIKPLERNFDEPLWTWVEN
jgi:maltose O-acetyltransferase